jgi:hypothetical protein
MHQWPPSPWHSGWGLSQRQPPWGLKLQNSAGSVLNDKTYKLHYMSVCLRTTHFLQAYKRLVGYAYAPVEYWYRHLIASNQNQDGSDTTLPPFLVCKSKIQVLTDIFVKKLKKNWKDKAIDFLLLSSYSNMQKLEHKGCTWCRTVAYSKNTKWVKQTN